MDEIIYLGIIGYVKISTFALFLLTSMSRNRNMIL